MEKKLKIEKNGEKVNIVMQTVTEEEPVEVSSYVVNEMANINSVIQNILNMKKEAKERIAKLNEIKTDENVPDTVKESIVEFPEF